MVGWHWKEFSSLVIGTKPDRLELEARPQIKAELADILRQRGPIETNSNRVHSIET
jgi:hypothetical protein